MQDDLQVECLNSWWQNKAADANLTAVLRGRSLQPEDGLQDVLQDCVVIDGVGKVHLKR